MTLNVVTSGSTRVFELKLEATLASQVNQYAYTILIGLQDFPDASKTAIQFLATVLAKPNQAP